jgi:aspartyl-tRNA(Asn)/glutamyl-tRNA(Gln) amidotransferase subunit C
MQIDDKLLTHLEKLAMLKIDEDQREGVQAQLSDVLGFVEKLGDLDTSGVEALYALHENPAPLREDEAQRSDVIDSVLQSAPKTRDGCFVVPKIVG